MPIRVTPAEVAARRFTTRGQAAAQDYQQAVQQAGADWASETAAAADSYAQGVQQAITRGAFAAGVQEAGAQKYASKASTVGAARFPQGIAAAGPDWQRGAGKYLQALAGFDPGPSGPRGDPRNIQRVVAVANLLRRVKLGQ